MSKRRTTAEGCYLVKESKRHSGKYYSYWWDITPPNHKELSELNAIIFIEKDTGKEYTVMSKDLLRVLTKERQTARCAGNWGIRILEEDVFSNLKIEEPGKPQEKWITVPSIENR